MEGLNPSDEDCEIPRCVTQRGLVLTLRGAIFTNGRAELDPMLPVLGQLVTVLSGYTDRDITIEGHTDTLGSEGYNYSLSQRRADSVKLHLIEQGLIIPRITARGMGGSRPLAANSTAAGRRQNSRVEVIVHAPLARADATQ